MSGAFATRGFAALCLIACVGARAVTDGRAATTPIEIYLSPVPPAMGAPFVRASEAARSARPAPSALAAFVGEPFYAPLSTRFAKQDAEPDLTARLEKFVNQRTALLTELRAQIDTLRDSEPSARQRRLEAFGAEQTPRIAALEKEAESIRQELSDSGSAHAEFARLPAAVRSLPDFAAYYKAGLTASQRRLLHERAIETGPRHSSEEASNPSGFFSPDTARLSLPSGVPAEIATALRAYWQAKAVLRARAQAQIGGPWDESAVRALERQAEGIRAAWARVSDPIQSPLVPAVPPELARRITGYRAEKLALQKALLERVEAVKKMGGDAAGEKIRGTIASFTAENKARYDALEKNKDEIRAEVRALPGTGDLARQNFSQSLRQLEWAWDYRDYRTALLLPGLSPEQRRLLFNGSLQEKLALPLPGAVVVGAER